MNRGAQLGHYEVLEPIGAGGMGEVYRARDPRLERDVAVKVLPAGTLNDEQARKRFRKEALALAKLNHPHIATVHDFDTQEGVDFLVMEHVEGTTLAERLKSGPLAERELTQIAAQVADALREAHEQGIVHRDLKPGNLKLTPRGQVKVLDFGLAKLLPAVGPGFSQGATTESFTESHLLAGTLPYMSPEQLQGEAVDARSDLYSLGVVLFEGATGRRPFEEKVSTALSDAILHQVPVTPRALNARVSPDLERIILKCLEKEPENRYQSAKELSVDLRRLAAPAAAQPSGPRRGALETLWRSAQRPPRPERSRRLPLGIGLTLVLFALLLGFNAGGLRERLARSLGSGSGTPHVQSLAVLPLENLSRDPEQDYFADGMTEELITELSKIGALKVISRTSVMQYKGVKKPMRQIARELGVDALIEGSVLRAGERVRVTAQLIHAATDTHLWAESYERDLRDVLALQSEVAQAIAREIQVKLTPGEQARLARTMSVNPAAREAYLKARYYRYQERAESLMGKGFGYFQEAIRLDPNYALAYAGLAEYYAALGVAETLGTPPREVMPKAQEAALKALEIDAGLAEAHTALGLIRLSYDWDWEAAEREFTRSLQLNPNSADTYHWYSHLLTVMGRHKESLQSSLRALEVDPLNPQMQVHLTWYYLQTREYDRAIEQATKTLELYPHSVRVFDYLAQAYSKQDIHELAIARAQKAVELSKRNPYETATLGLVYAAAGKNQEALRVLKELNDAMPHRYVPPYSLAAMYVALDDRQQAYAWLEKAYQDRVGWMAYLRVDPRFDRLRSDPRFQDLLRRMNFPE